jgi:hypothetical protein
VQRIGQARPGPPNDEISGSVRGRDNALDSARGLLEDRMESVCSVQHSNDSLEQRSLIDKESYLGCAQTADLSQRM